jgi:hypothetical protein
LDGKSVRLRPKRGGITMHSRIYQISKTPIDKDDYIQESHYWDHWFTNSVADYVNGDTNREEDIEWLKECHNNHGLSFGADEYGQYFVIEDKNKYFATNFETFKEALEDLMAMTIDEFSTNNEHHRAYSRLRAVYNDDLGFYVEEDDWLRSLDDFIRHGNVGVKYYIGATIDYHF